MVMTDHTGSWTTTRNRWMDEFQSRKYSVKGFDEGVSL